MYKNAASFYASSRPPYPPEIFKLIIEQIPEQPRDLYVDLGCGTGELLLPLSAYFKKSVGVDPEKAMLSEVNKKIKKNTHKNISLFNGTAEEYLTSLSDTTEISLVTAGRSFHWMNQELVTKAVFHHLIKGGAFVTLGEAEGGLWKRKSQWAQIMHDIIFKEFPHKEQFVPPLKRLNISVEATRNMLQKFSFTKIEDFMLEAEQQWTIETIINLFYSAADFLDWLGSDKEEFEKKARKALLAINSSGIFYETSKFGITCCVK
jgi:ubiquinone/menaquinone biosynthesis C-methylase UbiE